MNTLDLSALNVVFPRRCLSCGKPAATHYEMKAASGFDFLAFYVGEFVMLEVPACDDCRTRVVRGRIAWAILWVLLVPASWASILLVAFVTKGEDDPLTVTIATMSMWLLGAFSLYLTWWARNRAARFYHRLFGPVWVRSYSLTSRKVGLGFRDPRTRDDVGVLSKVLNPSVLAVQAGYRDHAAPKPIPFQAERPRNEPSWWAVVGLVVFAAGLGAVTVMRYFEFEEAARTRRSVSLRSLEQLFYYLAGREGVTAMWGVASLGVLAMAFVAAWDMIRSRSAHGDANRSNSSR